MGQTLQCKGASLTENCTVGYGRWKMEEHEAWSGADKEALRLLGGGDSPKREEGRFSEGRQWLHGP